MKKISLLTSILVLGTLAYGQDSTQVKSDTTKIKMGNSTILIFKGTLAEKSYDHDFTKCDSAKHPQQKTWVKVNLDLGINGYMGTGYDLSLPASAHLMDVEYPKSRSLAFYMSLKGADIIKNRLYFAPGIGIARNNYYFKNNINISTSNNVTSFTADSIIQYDIYKLRATYLEVPLILGAKIGNLKNPLGIQIGAIGGLKIGSSLKQKYKLDGSTYQVKIKDNFNINALKVDAIARITIGFIGLYARYSLTTFFEDHKALEVYPFSVGLTFDSF